MAAPRVSAFIPLEIQKLPIIPEEFPVCVPTTMAAGSEAVDSQLLTAISHLDFESTFEVEDENTKHSEKVHGHRLSLSHSFL